LVTRDNDTRYYYDDFSAFNGMKIGGIISDFREGLLSKKATNNSFQLPINVIRATIRP
jgi:hypothetical protein